jgi:hypothetical protein
MTRPTLALSLIQPWAYAVLHLGKDIENRTWFSDIRGPIWIAASAQVTRRYYEQAKELIASIGGVEVPPLEEFARDRSLPRLTAREERRDPGSLLDDPEADDDPDEDQLESEEDVA